MFRSGGGVQSATKPCRAAAFQGLICERPTEVACITVFSAPSMAFRLVGHRRSYATRSPRNIGSISGESGSRLAL